MKKSHPMKPTNHPVARYVRTRSRYSHVFFFSSEFLIELKNSADSPFQDRSPVLGTNYFAFDWFVPQTGLRY